MGDKNGGFRGGIGLVSLPRSEKLNRKLVENMRVLRRFGGWKYIFMFYNYVQYEGASASDRIGMAV